MQELVYQHGINSCFNSNIEAIRDATEVIGVHRMSNAYNSMSWGITDGGRLVVMIADSRPEKDKFKAVVVEFQGDGCCTIQACDTYGKPIDDNYDLFDTHYYNTNKSAHERFAHILKTRYDIVY